MASHFLTVTLVQNSTVFKVPSPEVIAGAREMCFQGKTKPACYTESFVLIIIITITD